MSFTTSEKIRMALSESAIRHHRNCNNWVRSYQLAGRDLIRMVNAERKEVIAELEENEEKFLKGEFFTN
jgi:hypothetical protein